jgi:hypothetical protein
MGSHVCFFCGPSDANALEKFSVSLGLQIIPVLFEQSSVPLPIDMPHCFLSPVPKSALHPYGHPPLKVTDARDPLLSFSRAYFSTPYLVMGRIHWNNDVQSLASQTKPYFQKLKAWMKREWEKRGDVYLGPEAAELIVGGAQQVNDLPGRGVYVAVAK